MERSLLDTDVYSEILRSKNPKIVERSDIYRAQFDRFTLSTVTVVELVSGLQRLQRNARIEALLDALDAEEVLPIDLDSATIAGRIHGDLVRTGRTIGHADPMIAAVAIRYALTLVTGNTQHFQRIVDLGYPLRLDDWRS
ncbi:PIN domain-containing protein [Lacipirellula limnantheis]|uniref:Ribonuclease VapC n=1 Tax=Lacipirellula limnantheis TaxID=2528024 RepID=A0A517U5U2_9BACT|nr:PIN domain-containing protein [Lacipirellula limnantheis]QDT76001.1 tRNA(fMet)-specific endonuclease VapC [Lacipirellula limnantheis]